MLDHGEVIRQGLREIRNGAAVSRQNATCACWVADP